MKVFEVFTLLGVGFWIGKEYSKKKVVIKTLLPICDCKKQPKEPTPSVCGKFNKKTQSFAA